MPGWEPPGKPLAAPWAAGSLRPARLRARDNSQETRPYSAAMSDSESTGGAGTRAVFAGILLVIGIGLAAMLLVPMLGR